MECQSIALIIHQEMGVNAPVQIQQLNYHDVLIEFDTEVDAEVGSSETIKDGMVDGGPM